MRVRATAATAALLMAALTACGGNDDSTDAKPKASASESIDCTSQTVSQADWAKHCSDEGAAEDAAGSEDQATSLTFGKAYTWPDGLKVSVVEAKVFTDYDAELMESAEPGMTDFRLKLKIENTGKAAVSLDELSMITEGATNGGEAASTVFENGAAPLEGRLAPGVSVTKTDDNVLETKYGRKIVVTVQRASDDAETIYDFPEFEGEITG